MCCKLFMKNCQVDKYTSFYLLFVIFYFAGEAQKCSSYSHLLVVTHLWPMPVQLCANGLQAGKTSLILRLI